MVYQRGTTLEKIAMLMVNALEIYEDCDAPYLEI